jgi:DMSO/TMAO reductase YedYZ heme-binding membrane subunit
MRRPLRHLVLAATTLGLALLLSRLVPGRARVERLSLATAHVSLGLLALTLALGPWAVLRGRMHPLSTHLRRDLGVWAAAWAAAHVGLGLQVHLGGRAVQYFVRTEPGAAFPLRLDAFGLANHAGAVAAVGLLVPLMVSSDAALRALGGARWKRIQRTVYVGALATAAHGAAYQVMERRAWPLVTAFAICCSSALALQLLGAWRVRAA